MSMVDEFFYANRLELGIAADKSAYMTSDATDDVWVSKVTPLRVNGTIRLDRLPRGVKCPG